MEVFTLALFWTAALFPAQRYNSSPQENLLSDSLAIINEILATSLKDTMSATMTDPVVLVSGPVLAMIVKLSTESMAWLGLCLQSWTTGLQPGSKKKKSVQSGPSERTVGALKTAIHAFCSHLEMTGSWATDCLGELKDKKHTLLLAGGDTALLAAPGQVMTIFTTALIKTNSMPKSWDAILKEIIDCQRCTLMSIRDSCMSRSQLMKSIKF